MTATATSRADTRTPLEVGRAIADRFMKTPRQAHYMWNVGLAGILDMYEATREQRYLDFYLGHTGGDQVRFDFRLFAVTGDKRFLTGARETADKHLANPHRDREGCMLDPRGRYTIDCLSGLFTSPLVLGHVLHDKALYDDALKSFEVHKGYLEEQSTGLWWSRWGHSLHPNRPNPGLWSRGNGWLVASWSKCAHLWDPQHPAYDYILAEWRRYCTNIARFQSEAGTFRQLLNRPDSFHEASGTALFCTGFSRGVINGTLPEEFAPIAYRAFCGLRALSDERGNLHNGSTFAGGYNFEWQYETTAYFNEPHATATSIAACAAAALLLQARPRTDTTPPKARPPIITREIAGALMVEPIEFRLAPEVAAPVLRRVMAMEEWPARDVTGGTIHGLLHWYDLHQDPAHLRHAEKMLELARKRLPAAPLLNAIGAVETRQPATANRTELRTELRPLVDAEIARLARDRNGTWVDEAGGYSIERLYSWLPLLGRVTTQTGDRRYLDEACAQFIGHQRWLEDSYTGLWFSAFGHGVHKHRCTPGLWALGNALLMTGIVDFLPHLPRDHPNYVDVVCTLRRLLVGTHTYFPVSEGWKQIMNRLDTFACTAATGLFTYASGKAILQKLDHPAYYAVTWGGMYHLSSLVDKEGNTKWSSQPTGACETIEAWQEHKTANDPATLGYVLSAAAATIACDKADVNRASNDGTRGAR